MTVLLPNGYKPYSYTILQYIKWKTALHFKIMYIHLGYFIAKECYYSLELRICVYPQIKENNNKNN